MKPNALVAERLEIFRRVVWIGKFSANARKIGQLGVRFVAEATNTRKPVVAMVLSPPMPDQRGKTILPLSVFLHCFIPIELEEFQCLDVAFL